MYAGRKPNTYKIRSEIRSQIRLTVVRRYVLSLKKSRCADRGFADSAGYAVLTPSRALAHLRMQRVRNAHPARALSLERCPHTKTFSLHQPTSGVKLLQKPLRHYPPQLACGEGLPHAFRLTAESGPSALPPPATGMYAREHGLLPHFPWPGRDLGGVCGVPPQTAAVVLSRCRELVLVIF